MHDDRIVEVGRLEAAWGAELTLQEIVRAEGAALLRLRIRQGRRFTDVELAPSAARELAGLLQEWAERTPGGE